LQKFAHRGGSLLKKYLEILLKCERIHGCQQGGDSRFAEEEIVHRIGNHSGAGNGAANVNSKDFANKFKNDYLVGNCGRNLQNIIFI
jgi:hypothetical protein